MKPRSTAGRGGTPLAEQEVVDETFLDDYILDVAASIFATAEPRGG